MTSSYPILLIIAFIALRTRDVWNTGLARSLINERAELEVSQLAVSASSIISSEMIGKKNRTKRLPACI